MDISVIIPTYQAANRLSNLLNKLHNQTLQPKEIIVVDSSSSDMTIEVAKRLGCLTKIIEKREFRHGRTRNLGANLSSGDSLVFMTQDALPINDFFLEKLSINIQNGTAVAASARQIAYPSANPIETFARNFNYPESSNVRTRSDIPELGIKTFFFSDVASIVDKYVFNELGGFPDNIIVNEDMYLCANIIMAGYPVAYQADAIVYHSHNYRFSQVFKRYFDIGVFFWQAQDMLQGLRPNNEGLRFLSKTIENLSKRRVYKLIPRVIFESILKYIAFQLGFHHSSLPDKLNENFSNQNWHFGNCRDS